MNYHNNKYISNLTLRVLDINKSLEFYKSVLGFTTIKEAADGVIIGPFGKPLLKLKQAKTKKQIRAAGLYHIAFLLPTREDLANWLYYCLNNNIAIEGASNHLVSEAIYLHDIDGNGIEVYADTPANTWVWKNESIKMTTERLDIEGLFKEVTKPTNKLGEGTIIGHIHLSVLDLKKSQEFYSLLGFEVVLELSSAAFMSSSNYHHHLGMNVWNTYGGSLHNEEQADLDNFSIHYPSKAEVDLVLERLAKQGINYSIIDNIIKLKDNNNIEIILEYS